MNTSNAALLIDFGSTYTKLRAVDLSGRRLLARGQGPSTVATDITLGLSAALKDLEQHLGKLPSFRYRLASSSAAGGLRMVTVGLVRELTAEAARQAALGAGARLVGTFAYQLTGTDIECITELAPDILLLAGGTDGGNTEVILGNARALAGAPIRCPIVVAGNRVAADEVQTVLAAAGKPVVNTENVMPEFGMLAIEPAREAIRQVFINRIVHAKGIDRAQSMFDKVLMPTPAAVLEGARLLSEGHGEQAGLGPLLVVDIGGATTDVHSVCEGKPTHEGIVLQGLPEPYLKRTVEGDLGMRHNAMAILEAAGLDALATDAGLPASRVRQLVQQLQGNIGRLPADAEERCIDRTLARAAVRIAVRRHAGTTETVYTVSGPVSVQRGKDLSELGAVIGTGGPLASGVDATTMLAMALADPAEPLSLRPQQARLLLDRSYILYACGLLATVEPEAALALALTHIKTVGEEAQHERSSIG
jgi:uncharacterized protein (TIGR01319 family)